MVKLNAQNYHLLISLLKGNLEPGFVEACIQAGADWNSVFGKAVEEGIFYPFYKNLLFLEMNKKLIPDELVGRFRQMYYLHISKSTDFSSQIEKAFNCIESFKIKTLLFKGPAIDYLIYDDFLRPRIDLDIVVEGEQIAVLEKALFDLGYDAPEEEKNYPLPEYLNSRLFVPRPNGFVPIHVHKHLINNMFLTVDRLLSMKMKDVWEESGLFKNYQHLYVLKPELNIIYLCEHGLKHDFDQIIFLYEIEALIRNYREGLDWKKLVALAEDSGLGRAVYYGLYFVKEVLSADIPEEVIDSLKPKKLTFSEKIFIKNTLSKKHRRYASYPVYLAMRRGLSKKANFIFRTFFPPEFKFKGYLNRMARLILP